MAEGVIQSAPGLRRRFYLGLSVFIALVVLTGFWPSYFGAFVNGAVDRPLVIHIHAAIYVGWLALFIAQTAFAATGNIALHMRLGRFAIGYGVIVIFAGLAAAFGMFAIRVSSGLIAEAQANLVGPLLDMVVFAPFFAAAIVCRREPVLHKRLMIVATTALLIAAVGRMQFLGGQLWLVQLIWTSPILLAIGHDVRRGRGVHWIYVAGIVVLALESPITRGFLRGTGPWLDTTAWLAGLIGG